MCPALGDHLEQATAGTLVLLVLFQMFRQLLNSLINKSDLHGRGARVLVVDASLLDYRLLFLGL